MRKQIAAIAMDFGLTTEMSATTLQGCDICVTPVDDYDSNALYLYESVTTITWFKDGNFINVELQP